jgi:hypothetical protein
MPSSMQLFPTCANRISTFVFLMLSGDGGFLRALLSRELGLCTGELPIFVTGLGRKTATAGGGERLHLQRHVSGRGYVTGSVFEIKVQKKRGRRVPALLPQLLLPELIC